MHEGHCARTRPCAKSNGCLLPENSLAEDHSIRARHVAEWPSREQSVWHPPDGCFALCALASDADDVVKLASCLLVDVDTLAFEDKETSVVVAATVVDGWPSVVVAISFGVVVVGTVVEVEASDVVVGEEVDSV